MKFSSIPRNGLVFEALLDGDAIDTNDGTKLSLSTAGMSYATAYSGYKKQMGVFNGAASYVATPANSFPTLTNNVSVAFSFRDFGGGAGTQTMFANGHNISATNMGWLLMAYNGKFNFTKPGIINEDSGVYLPLIGEHFVVFSIVSNVGYLYLDNKLVWTGSNSTSVSNNTNVTSIGASQLSSSFTQFFNGKIGSVRFYNRVIAEFEREQLWHEFNRKLGGGSDFGAYVPAPIFASETDGTTSSDVSNAVNSTLTGTRATANNRLGLPTAYSFNGSSNENFGDNALWSPSTNPITIVTEFYQTATPGTDYGGLVAKYVAGNSGNSEFFFATHTTGKLYITGNGTDVVTSAASYVVNNTWQCAAAVIRATSAKIYHEDMTVASGNLTLGSDTGTGMFLGDFSSADKKFTGRIGRTYIFPGELTSDQIKYVFGCIKSGRYPYAFRRSILNNLRTKANWWLGYGDRDISGNANNGTSTSVTAIRNGQCLGGSYNGSSSYIETGTAQALDACTLAATVQVSSTGSAQVIMGQRATGSSQKNLVMKIRSGGVVGFFMRNSGVGLDGSELIGSIVMQAGKKYRVVVTRNGATYRAYVNGAFDTQITNGSASTTASATFTTAADWDRGTAYERLTGQIFDPVVYGSALTDEEVRNDYYATFNGL